MKVKVKHDKDVLEFDSIVRARKSIERWIRLDVEAFGWTEPYHIYDMNDKELEYYLATYDDVPQIKHYHKVT